MMETAAITGSDVRVPAAGRMVAAGDQASASRDVAPSVPAAWRLVTACIELAKPKIAIMELVAVVTAACLAGLDFARLVHALVGTLLVAASASAANQWLEQDVDRRMARTANRPLPSGRLTAREAVLFGLVSLVIGTAYLAAMVNLATAAWGLLAWGLYVLLYTPLKTRSTANTHVGAVAGALPMLMGWTAMGTPLDLTAATLWTLLFLWQFPHFMAIAWIYRHDYQIGGMKMATVVDPSGRRAATLAAAGAASLIPVSLLPFVLPHRGASPAYGIAALAAGLAMLAAAMAFYRERTDDTARRLLRASLVYLPVLLLSLMWGTY